MPMLQSTVHAVSQSPFPSILRSWCRRTWCSCSRRLVYIVVLLCCLSTLRPTVVLICSNAAVSHRLSLTVRSAYHQSIASCLPPTCCRIRNSTKANFVENHVPDSWTFCDDSVSISGITIHTATWCWQLVCRLFTIQPQWLSQLIR